MAKSTLRIQMQISEPTGQTELTHVFKNPGTIAFEDRYHHYIHPAALRGVTQLTIEGLKDAEIHFLAPLMGKVDYQAAYRPDSGVLNLVGCQNVIVSGAFQNHRPYDPANLTTQTGNAVNIDSSTVKFVHSKIWSAARMPFAVHSGSTVEVEDSIIEGDYFEFFNGASSLTVRRCEVIQEADFPDSHSMLWVGSSHRHAITNELFENGYTLFDTCRFKMKTGRALVSGNGSYETRSNVEFRNCEVAERDQNFGVASWHENYNSITVQTNGTFGEFSEDVLRVGPGTSGFGRFVDYYQGGGGKPGGVDEVSPVIVDHVGSESLPE